MPKARYAAVAFWTAVTAINVFFFLTRADLKPRVDENFFFSSSDPQLAQDKSIDRSFPQPSQVIVSVRGDVRSQAHLERVESICREIASWPGVTAVQSLTRGPDSPEAAFESPLWSRLLVGKGGRSSCVIVFIDERSVEPVISRFEALRRAHQSDGDVVVSGAPYIIEMIRRNLARDLRVFGLAAVFVFGLAVLAAFRSAWILAGVLAACVNTSLASLFAAQALRISIGPLTANVSTIVFVLALSHIVFITYNWKRRVYEPVPAGMGSAAHAVRMTFLPSVWSMSTTLLGFLSLLFVPATPLKQLGVAGAVGTVLALVSAYLIYPPFLAAEEAVTGRPLAPREKPSDVGTRLAARKGSLAAAVALPAVLFAAAGIWKLNTDPSLFSYFRDKTPLREGLEFVDRNGGSIPLEVVVVRPDGGKLTDGETIARLSELTRALETEETVGHVLSLPVFLEEARRKPFFGWMPSAWLVELMRKPRFGSVTPFFLTDDGKRMLFVLRMNEASRLRPREEIVARVREIVREKGFEAALVGGVYALQGQLSDLVSESILVGLGLLVLIFIPIAWAASGSWRTSLAVAFGISLVPLGMLGVIGAFGIPFDIISAPAANISIGIGVDCMLHMVVYARRRKSSAGAAVWDAATSALWRPVVYSTLLICAGFGIFSLSSFPPTQRFGLSVVLGSLIAPPAALGVFPWVAAFFDQKNLSKASSPRVK